MLPALQERARDNPTLKLLDVGCGPGSISIGLAKCIPDGHLTGVDLAPAVLEQAAQAAAEHGVGNISFQTGDIYGLPFADGAFDVVHAHQILGHCHEAVRAVRELVRVTKKGGLLCMREADVHSARFWPESPLVEEALMCVPALLERTGGGYSDAGRRLKAWTVEAGVPRESIVHTAGTWCYDTPEARRGFDGGRTLRGGTADKAVELGITTRARIEEYEKAWKVWEASEDRVMMVMHGEVVASV